MTYRHKSGIGFNASYIAALSKEDWITQAKGQHDLGVRKDAEAKELAAIHAACVKMVEAADGNKAFAASK